MKHRALQFALILFGSMLVITGIKRQEVHTVLTKAINICLECIGIG